MRLAKAGYRVACLKCKVEIYELVVDVAEGEEISASQFKGVNGFPDPVEGDEKVCPNCNRLLSNKVFSRILVEN